jgi:hypothetical protein
MKHRGTIVTLKSLRQPSRFPRIDMPSDAGESASPRFALAIFLCFVLATAAIRFSICAAAYRH